MLLGKFLILCLCEIFLDIILRILFVRHVMNYWSLCILGISYFLAVTENKKIITIEEEAMLYNVARE